MHKIINEKLINRNKKISMALFIFSLAVLIGGAVLAWPAGTDGDMSRTMYSWVALVIGFILTRLSMYFMTRFGQSPRPDEILDTQAFGKLRSDYTYFVYSTPVPMLLLGPCRLWLPVLVTSGGTISYEDGKWKHKGLSVMKRFMGQQTLVDPEESVTLAIQDLNKQYDKQGYPLEDRPEIQPIVVLLLPETYVENIKDAPYPVVKLEDLKRYIRKIDREACGTPLNEEERQNITTALTAGKIK